MPRILLLRSFVQLLAAGIAGTLYAGCTAASADDDTVPQLNAAARAEPVRELAIAAAEYAYRAPDTIPSGLVRLRLVNQGGELHHMQVIRLAPGYRAMDLIGAMPRAPLANEWATPVGGPGAIPPGGSSNATLDLVPGEYALICFIPADDHVAHFRKGMLRSLVVPAGAPERPEPAADTRLVLGDLGFTIGQALHAGRQVVRVENAARAPHEVLVAKLERGARVDDALAWVHRPRGPRPFVPVGGVAMLATGQSNLTTLDLTPGDYAVFSLALDSESGVPRFDRAAMKAVRVE